MKEHEYIMDSDLRGDDQWRSLEENSLSKQSPEANTLLHVAVNEGNIEAAEHLPKV